MIKLVKRSLFFIPIFWSTNFFSYDSYGKAETKKKNYSLFLTLKQNTSAKQVSFSPSLGINYLHLSDWSLGFSVGYFTNQIENKSFKIFEISKQVNYEIRIFHPLYLQLGPTVSYLKPLEANKRFNIASHENYKANFSLAGEMSLLFKPTPESLLFKMSFSPWTSFSDKRFRGYFFSTGIGYLF